ncbi:MAG: hypothetical protein AB1477_08630 [Acidobacteriota bacterium]|jgi:hypothetical protein
MNKKTTIFMLCFLMIYLIGIVSVFGQNKEVDLKDKRITIKTEKVHFGTVLGYLMEVYEIPIGFEQSILDRNTAEFRFSSNSPGISYYSIENDDGVLKIPANSRSKPPLHPVTLNAENERLENVLNIIVKQVENYRWEINDGVVNIYPLKGRDDKFERLLDLKISKFVLEKGKPIWEITTKIKLLPEFVAFTEKNNLRFSGGRSGPDVALQKMYGKKVSESMDFSNLTFKELLNKITKVKKGGWILKWRFVSKKTGEEFIDIDI